MSLNLVTLLYLVASVCFIQALKGLSHPDHLDPRQPLRHGRHGHRRAHHRGADRQARRAARRLGMGWVLLGLVVGGGYGAWRAKTVEMTKMPELVAFFHSMIGLAAVFIAVAAVAEPGPSASSPRASPSPPATGWSCSWARPSAPSPSRGSVIAFGKLSGKYKFRLFKGAPVVFPGQHLLNLVLGLADHRPGPGVHVHRELAGLLR